MPASSVAKALRTVTSGSEMSREEARAAVRAMLENEVGDSLVAGLLVALKMKGESAGEIAGFAEGMRDVQVSIRPRVGLLVDTCGTGGDRTGTFNISTAAAIIASAAGVSIAKHGNRSVSSRCGSADVLDELGVDIAMDPEKVCSCIESLGIGFLFAPNFHPAMKRVVEPRRSLGLPTIFNVVGPLTNPAGARAQVIGVNRADLVETLGEVLSELGSDHVFVLHGMDGMDEFTLTAETLVCEIREGRRRTKLLAPEDLGLARFRSLEFLGGDATQNASIIHEVLSGAGGPKADICVANAAFAIVVAGRAVDLKEGVRLARDAIESGAARRKLDALVEFSCPGGAGDVPR